MAINFPDSPSLNDLYTDSTTGFTYKWDGEVWKSAVLSQPNGTKELGDISSSFDGIETVFALTISGVAVTPINAQQLIINLGGVIQNAGDDYTVSGSNITFTTPPASGLSFTGLFVGSAISLNSLSTYAVEPEDLTTGGPSWNTSGDVAVSGVATISNTGSASTALYVAGGARITGILTVGSSSVRIDGDNSIINVGTGLTINSSGITAGFITATSYYGDGSNLDNVGLGSTSSVNTSGIITASYFYGSGIGITNAGPLGRIAPITYSPGIGETSVGLTTNIVLTFNKPLLSIGNTITLRTGAADGTIVESYDVSTSDRLTISGGVLTIDPTNSLSGLTTYFVVVPEGSFGDKLNTSTNAGITTYSFTSQQLNKEFWLMGYNGYGQLGQNDITQYSSPVQIPGNQWSSFSGTYNSMFTTKTDGTLWAWGRNHTGQLGQNSFTPDYSSPVQIPGTQWSDLRPGQNQYSYNFHALKTDGTAWSWGYNASGGLGLNDLERRSSPTQIPGTQWSIISSGGIDTSYGIKTDGTLWSWGYNYAGVLGVNDRINYSSPRQVPGTQWSGVEGGYYSTVAKKTDGTLWAFGRNNNGQLGQNQYNVNYSSPTQIPGTQWNVISFYHCGLATKTDGTLWAWGQNTYGPLSQNDIIPRSSPVQIPGTQWNLVSTGAARPTLATKTDETLWAWGRGDYGSLGQNDNVHYSSPTQIPGTGWSKIEASYIVGAAIKQTS